MSESMSTDAARAKYESALRRMPPRMRGGLERALNRWPGRIGIRIAATCIRIEIFDRSMTIAAQFFTSIFPIVIVLGAWVGTDGQQLADSLSVPQQTEDILEQAVGSSGSDAATFGIIGTLIVLAAATSLSRALTRAFAAIWDLPRPHIQLDSAWRWVAVVLALALTLVTTRAVSQVVSDIPPATLWELAAGALVDIAIVVFVPWVLMAGQVSPRRLVPGAVIFAAVMVFVRPTTGAWLPHALDVSADRYGSIGVAFTCLAWLYVVAYCLLAASVVGKVVAMDPGVVGRWIRGGEEGAGAPG